MSVSPELLRILRTPTAELAREIGGQRSSAFLSGVAPSTQLLSREQLQSLVGALPQPEVQRNSDFTTFLESTFSAAVPELVGNQPNARVSEFRNRRPGLGFVSQLAGFAAPFAVPAMFPAVGLNAARAIPGVARLAQFAETAAGARPIAASAATEVARFAPLELGRLGASVVAGDPVETAKAVATDVPLFGLFGAGAGFFRGTVQSRAVQDTLEFAERTVSDAASRIGFKIRFNLNDPNQVKLGNFRAFLNSKELAQIPDREVATRLKQDLIPALEDVIRAEIPRDGAFVKGLRNVTATKRANTLFREGQVLDRDAYGKRPLSVFNKDLGLVRRALGKEFEQHVQFPRIVDASTPKKQAEVFKALQDDMVPVGDGFWLAEERKGLYVMLKAVPGQRVPAKGRTFLGVRAHTPDDYVIFKTTDPSRFAPKSASLLKKNEELYLDQPPLFASKAEGPTPVSDRVDRLIKVMGPRAGVLESADLPSLGNALGDIPGVRGAASAVRETLDARLSRWGVNTMGEARKVFGDQMLAAKEHLAPLATVVSENPLARSIVSVAQASYAGAAGAAMRKVFGEATGSKAQTPIGVLFRTQERTGGVDRPIRQAMATERGRADFMRGLLMTEEDMVQAGIGSEVRTAVLRVKELFENEANEILWHRQKLDLPTTDSAIRASLEDFLAASTMRGRFRLPIFAKDGKTVVGVVSGHSKGDALDEAKFVIERINAFRLDALADYSKTAQTASLTAKGRLRKKEIGQTLDPGEHFLDNVDASSDIQLMQHLDLPTNSDLGRAVLKARLDFMNEFVPASRQFIGRGASRIPTRQEFTQRLYSSIVESERTRTKEALDVGLRSEMTRLASQDAHTFRLVGERLGEMAGKPSSWAKQQDDTINRLLEPIFGPNVASETVRRWNRAMFGLTLGFGDMGFVALNALTPIQTALPEIAFVLGGLPEDLAKYYSASMVMSRAGATPMRMLDPLRVLKQGFKDMFTPDTDLLDDMTWAAENHVATRPFIEAVVGQDAELLSLARVRAGEESLIELIIKGSEFLPAKSEEFSRGLSFIVGRRIARDFFKMGKEEAREFGRQFTERTMYGYGTADRARILTGSLGTGLGLFKNWTFHYMAQLGVYGKQALMRRQAAPLMYMGMGTFSVAGAAGVPLFGVADWASRALTDDGLVTNLYDLMSWDGEPIGGTTIPSDFLLYGFPSLVGVSLQGRAAAPTSDPVRDLSMLVSLASFDRAAAAYGLMPEAMDAWVAGHGALDNPQFTNNLVRAFAPRTVQKLISVWGNELSSLRTGNKLSSNLSSFQSGLHALGLTPLSIEKTFEANSELYRDRESQQGQIRAFGKALAGALELRDSRTAGEVQTAAMQRGDIPLDSIYQSAMSRIDAQQRDNISRQHDAYLVQQEMRLRGLMR